MKREDKILKTLDEHTNTLVRMQETLDEHTQKLHEHDGLFEKIFSILDAIIVRLDNMDKKFDDMNRSILLIEDEVHNKIPALFDAHGFHQDHLEKHDEEIEDLQNKTENHSLRIISLEDESKEHSKQLENLSTTH